MNSNVNWKFAKRWALSFYGEYIAVDFENGNRGDSDWYLYDIDEFGVGLGIAYLF